MVLYGYTYKCTSSLKWMSFPYVTTCSTILYIFYYYYRLCVQWFLLNSLTRMRKNDLRSHHKVTETLDCSWLDSLFMILIRKLWIFVERHEINRIDTTMTNMYKVHSLRCLRSVSCKCIIIVIFFLVRHFVYVIFQYIRLTS